MTTESNTNDKGTEAQDKQAEESVAAEAAEEEQQGQAGQASEADDPVAAAQAEVEKLKEQMLREQAETMNMRKRMQRDVENARKFALEKMAAELLPVVDNLERAIDAAGTDEAVKPVVEGIQLTYKSFLDVLEKFNIKQINPVGEPFDPQFHEAVTMVPNPDMEPDSVMDVMQKGYTLNDRLLRAAMVVVSKAP